MISSWGVLNPVNHFKPFFYFYTPWKRQKSLWFSDVFRGYRNILEHKFEMVYPRCFFGLLKLWKKSWPIPVPVSHELWRELLELKVFSGRWIDFSSYRKGFCVRTHQNFFRSQQFLHEIHDITKWVVFVEYFEKFKFIQIQYIHQIETSQFNCCANQVTGFYTQQTKTLVNFF